MGGGGERKEKKGGEVNNTQKEEMKRGKGKLWRNIRSAEDGG